MIKGKMVDGQECRDRSLDLSEMDRPEGLSISLTPSRQGREETVIY
jgi:hypothetical protein